MAKKVDPQLEAVKEAGRVVVLALVSWLVSYVAGLPQTETTAILLVVLRALDKYVHEDKSIKFDGLVPF